MLALTKRTEYALIALHYMLEQNAVAQSGQGLGDRPPASAREISERFNVPLPLLMNILKKLSADGILISIRGAKGGYALSADPKKLSLSQLIKSLEGPVAVVDCACPPEQLKAAMANCKTSVTCPIRGPMHVLHHRLADFLESTTIWDVCRPHPTTAPTPLQISSTP